MNNYYRRISASDFCISHIIRLIIGENGMNQKPFYGKEKFLIAVNLLYILNSCSNNTNKVGLSLFSYLDST